MYRTALQSSARALRTASRTNLASASRRFASTTAAPRKRTWKGAAARWGLAIGAVYLYNTSPLFADEPEVLTRAAPPHFSEADDQTVDAVIEEKRRNTPKSAPPPPLPAETKAAETTPAASDDETAEAAKALEEEAGQQGAFNPETGEINWDCPCLGGMAHGPCGEEFKAAFSCFVYSNEEPKGMDCIDKFQHMQDCFRQYPEIYAAELTDDETDAASPEGETVVPAEAAKTASEPPVEPATASPAAEPTSSEDLKQLLREEAEEAEIPAKVHDATDANNNVPPSEGLKQQLRKEAKEADIPAKVHDATDANKDIKP